MTRYITLSACSVSIRRVSVKTCILVQVIINYLQVIIYRLMDSICSDGAQKELLRKAHSWAWYGTWNHNGCKEGRKERFKGEKSKKGKEVRVINFSSSIILILLRQVNFKNLNLLCCSTLWPYIALWTSWLSRSMHMFNFINATNV